MRTWASALPLASTSLMHMLALTSLILSSSMSQLSRSGLRAPSLSGTRGGWKWPKLAVSCPPPAKTMPKNILRVHRNPMHNASRS